MKNYTELRCCDLDEQYRALKTWLKWWRWCVRCLKGLRYFNWHQREPSSQQSEWYAHILGHTPKLVFLSFWRIHFSLFQSWKGLEENDTFKTKVDRGKVCHIQPYLNLFVQSEQHIVYCTFYTVYCTLSIAHCILSIRQPHQRVCFHLSPSWSAHRSSQWHPPEVL